jgi:uncharacterized membrane protein YhaH (DUF805 family)
MPPAPPVYQPAPAGPPLLSAPYYRAPFGVAIARFWQKYATFSGRASRSEYWWWYLAYVVFSYALQTILNIAFGSAAIASVSAGGTPVFGPGYYVENGIIYAISLAVLVPSLAIFWRRLHDTNRSGLYFFLFLIPLVGLIILIVFLASAPNPAGARFDRPEAA